MAEPDLRNKAAIVGIGATEFSKNSGRSELRLAVESVSAALADAGLDPARVNGLVTFMTDTNDEVDVQSNLGIPELRFFCRTPYGGGGGCGTVFLATLAIAAGMADVVVCYRAFNERSGLRYGQARERGQAVNTQMIHYSWYQPYGLDTPAGWVAMYARRYMHQYEATSEDFGRVAVASRKHAANNPAAWFYQKPITLEEHQASRLIVDPLHLLDCCQESDGAVALVVASPEVARDLRQPPAMIRAAAQGSGPDQESMTSYYRPDITAIPEMNLVGRQLFKIARLTPADIQTAVLYEHFSPSVLTQLEELGFCGRGEAKDFIKDGAIELGGRLPINTHGGQLGEAYIHGFNGIAEGVRQIRGTSVNQVSGVEHVLVTSGTAVPTSGLILGKA
jgi:acetyl-CoA acetyltransferase